MGINMYSMLRMRFIGRPSKVSMLKLSNMERYAFLENRPEIVRHLESLDISASALLPPERRLAHLQYAR
jgi:hypothetical protein